MKNILIALITLCSFTCAIAEPLPDISFDDDRVIINKVSPAVIDALQTYNQKETGTIIFTEKITQVGFDDVIKNSPWIKRVRVKGKNENIFNIRALSQLESLVSLELADLPESKRIPIDLTPLEKLTALTVLNLSSTQTTNTKSLSKLVNLEEVVLNLSDTDSLDFLKATPKVKKLSIFGGNKDFLDYSPLANLNQLEALYISSYYNPTDDNLAALTNIKTLKEIRLYDSNITHLNFLKNSINLIKINVSFCNKLADISVFKDMQSLQNVDLTKTLAEQLDMLKGKTQLQELNIHATRVKDITILNEMINLKYLSMSQTGVNDVTPLLKLTNLRTIILNKEIPASEVAKLKNKFPNASIIQ